MKPPTEDMRQTPYIPSDEEKRRFAEVLKLQGSGEEKADIN
jgi:hypothetical protein